MRSSFLIVLTIIAYSGFTRIEAQTVYSNEHVDVIKLDEGFYLLRENYEFTANCLVLEGENGLLLLDSGFGEMGEYLVDALISLGKPVNVIVNSHAHHDHLGANHLFGDDVLVVGHKNCRDDFEKTGHKVRVVQDSYTFDFEGKVVFCMSYPGGHSQCDIMTLIPDLNMAYLGDIYLSESFPLIILESGGTVESLLIHLNEIFESLPDETRMFPGHGKETSLEYFGGYIALVEETVDVVRKKMKSGWSLERIQEAQVLKKWEKWGSFFPFITQESWIEQIFLSYSK